MKLVDTMKRLIVIFLFGILCRCAFAGKNFWNNEICTTDSDCSGLTSCDLTFGCTTSGPKVGLVMLVVFLALCAIMVAVAYLCRRNLRGNRFSFRPTNQYLPQTVITTNTPPWNQQQMGVVTHTVYPPNPQPNQFYANSVNQPAFNPYLAENRMGVPMNPNQMPTAPYPPVAFDTHASQTYYSKR